MVFPTRNSEDCSGELWHAEWLLNKYGCVAGDSNR